MQKTKSNSVCLLIIAVIILLLTAQSFFSFSQTDESNYAAFTYRIYTGDALFRDEWHPTQLYSPLLFPFYLIFRIFSHDNTGIILYYRILYTFFSGAAAVFLYKRLDPLYRSMPALCAALFCLLYSRANINGCSYYKLSFLLVLISAVLLREKNKKSILISGICTACAVLCNPYLVLYAILNCMILVFRKGPDKWQLFLMYPGGMLIPAVFYLAFILRRCTIQDIIGSLPYIMNVPDRKGGLPYILNGISVQSARLLIPRSLIVLGLFVLLYMVQGIRKKPITGPLAAAYNIFIVLFLIKSVTNASNAVCFGISFPFALSLLPLAVYKLIRGRFDFSLYLYFAGLLTAAAWALCSDTVLDAMTVGFTVSSIAGILMLMNIEKREGRNPLHPVLTGLAAGILIFLFVCFRFFGFYRDAPFRQLNTKITKGPAAGLFTTAEHADEYNSIYDSIMEIYLKDPDEKVMFSKSLPWGYLCTSWGIGAPTTWSNKISNYWMEPYFSSHPDKIPTFVFILQPSVAGYESVTFNNHKVNHKYNSNKMAGWFYENYISKAEIIKETNYLTVYRLNN